MLAQPVRPGVNNDCTIHNRFGLHPVLLFSNKYHRVPIDVRRNHITDWRTFFHANQFITRLCVEPLPNCFRNAMLQPSLGEITIQPPQKQLIGVGLGDNASVPEYNLILLFVFCVIWATARAYNIISIAFGLWDPGSWSPGEDSRCRSSPPPIHFRTLSSACILAWNLS